ncbi:hypothetical protein OO006_05730 [Prosthecochloris sp. SCSIO W1101]|uniref:hypothetical protein n=1 Tax=Prosthecochloris sp. SCSIO W1101 TaxID=2992242 RepID=UPI00223CAD60|nr:hypothetical protein [Prosthecochloris sp. SCSIO W1101]UZJ42448.1 hypothetical protein OO006_05730 [Prosthecochloris sp. SCSIO W1101]
MKFLLIQLGIMLVVFLALWLGSPFVIEGIAQWPDWLKDSNVQFLLSLAVSLILAFNPATAKLVRNTMVIKGNNNQVIQGTRTAKSARSAANTAKVIGNDNQAEQG